MKKLLSAMLLIGCGTYFFYRYVLDPSISRFTLNNEWPLPPVIISLCWILLSLMIIDLIYHTRISLLAAPAVYFVTFFTGNQALWASEILWNKNYLLTVAILAVYALVLLTIIYRADPEFGWITKKLGDKQEGKPGANWKSLSLWNKAVAVFGLFILSGIALYVPYKVVLTCGYLINQDQVVKRARVLGHGSTRGKNFFRRYWDIEIDGRQERFWIYAAANTEPEGKYKCSTHTDPDTGSTLVIKGRDGIFGFSYDRLLEIRDAQGNIICN
ncbi:MAG: hypothetical protein EOO88_12775 [Pedobacter sp.]|nr:MAG: hypothetical protein EOO88_12775 [Pedobacter sp.]